MAVVLNSRPDNWHCRLQNFRNFLDKFAKKNRIAGRLPVQCSKLPLRFFGENRQSAQCLPGCRDWKSGLKTRAITASGSVNRQNEVFPHFSHLCSFSSVALKNSAKSVRIMSHLPSPQNSMTCFLNYFQQFLQKTVFLLSFNTEFWVAEKQPRKNAVLSSEKSKGSRRIKADYTDIHFTSDFEPPAFSCWRIAKKSGKQVEMHVPEETAGCLNSSVRLSLCVTEIALIHRLSTKKPTIAAMLDEQDRHLRRCRTSRHCALSWDALGLALKPRLEHCFCDFFSLWYHLFWHFPSF